MSVTIPLPKPTGGAALAGAVSAPAKARMVLGTLIIVAAVANLPLAMANVALPATSSHALEHLP